MYEFILVYHCNYSCLGPFSSYLTINIVNLKSRLGIIEGEGHWKWHVFDRSHIRVPIRLPL